MNVVVLPISDVSTIPLSLLLEAETGMHSAMEYLHTATFFGAYMSSLLIGICALRENEPGDGEIITISIIPTHRQTNVPRSLIKRTILYAKLSHWHRLIISVDDSNTKAVELYLSCGFKAFLHSTPCAKMSVYAIDIKE
ncbi:MAG: GNAT family N-acetyltransferase [Akkermansia sp.]